MSEQPASAARQDCREDGGRFSSWTETTFMPPFGRSRTWPVNSRGGTPACRRALACDDFGLAHQEQVGVVGRQRAVERRLDDVAGPRRADQPRRHDDGEIGLVLLVRPRCGTARRAPARRRATAVAAIAFLPSFCSRPPITKLWPSRSSTVVQARRTISGGMRDRPPIGTGLAGVELADLRLDLQVDQAVASTVGVKARPTP